MVIMTVQAVDKGDLPEAAFDPVLLAVLNRRFEGIVGKMTNTLLRTARSGVINSGRDFSCCILTGDAELLAVGKSLPIHVMVGPDMMARSMKEFHPELRRGDAFLHNSPYHGCSHAADLSVLVPVIDDDGVHRLTVLAKAHQADIGNSIPTTYMATARDVYEEGALIFPAVKVQEDYRDIEDIIRICMMRIRVPEQWHGDYLAELGAARIGERELLALGAEVGWEVLEAYVRAWFDYSEESMIAALQRLPSGRARGKSVHDPFPGTPPEGIPVQATVTVDSEAATIEVDYRDNIDCIPCGFNLSEACAKTAAMVGIFNSLGLTIPPNAGSFRRIKLHLRENCVVGIPRHPTSCSVATTNVADRATCAVQSAIAEFGEGIGMAEVGLIHPPGAAVISGHDPRHEDAAFVNQLILGNTGGAGAPSEDGWLTNQCISAAGMCFFDSIEIDEIKHPIRVHERRIVSDSEGAGKFRGAPGMRIEYESIDCSMRLIYASDGTINGARGVRGGLGGAPARQYKRNRAGELVDAPRFADFVLEPGESIIGVTCGGGGYGPPTERDIARVKHDIDEGYVTGERAEEIYGVVLDESGSVDEEATATRRRSREPGTPETA